ncbi:hypothetical protein CNYM01_13824 [Colletotrichum nymphaeae SA-01]|uniref:Uncharacterized protein n=1 Tax=Colletotrichum nymphaeae SA-01 TaxID=1460502 RepID=A0A135UXX5_9PEZI|nr:hypothetical protein CNYM01_13824 [Colletotrichum nymphaeae SA-01]
MSLWMGLGWDEILKSIPQRNATPPRRSCSVCGTRHEDEDAQAEHFTHPAIHHPPTQASQVKPTQYSIQRCAVSSDPCWTAPVQFIFDGHHNVDIRKKRPIRDERGESLRRRHPRLDSASGGAALVLHAGLFPVLPVWLATGQWYLDEDCRAMCGFKWSLPAAMSW